MSDLADKILSEVRKDAGYSFFCDTREELEKSGWKIAIEYNDEGVGKVAILPPACLRVQGFFFEKDELVELLYLTENIASNFEVELRTAILVFVWMTSRL